MAMVAYAFYEGNSRIQQYIKALAMRGDTVDFICPNRWHFPLVETDGTVSFHRIQGRWKQEESKLHYLFRVTQFLFASAWKLTSPHYS
jgi:hypothetical protein